MDYSRAREIADVRMGRPHVVLLGAGASLASFPDGDANGNRLPLMTDLVETLALGECLDRASVAHAGRNFEEVYAELHAREDIQGVRDEVEQRVYDYFSSLTITDAPTIYDYLVLGLRKKDVIATFNWDPFLTQALRRNRGLASSPRLLFLHGNVLAGVCETHKVVGMNGNVCSKCRLALKPTRLLYPVVGKNYDHDPMSSAQWEELRGHMQGAFMFTVFGYSAPSSDVAAVDLLKKGWGSPANRKMEETEMIDIKSEDDLARTWEPFIHSHHYSVTSNFFESWIARHPRRTGEAYIAQIIDALFADGNPVPKGVGLDELQGWFGELVSAEA